jgi:hypothetical protein
VVDGAREHSFQLGAAHPCLERWYLRCRLDNGSLVVFGSAKIEQDDRIVEVARQLLDARKVLLDFGALARDELYLLLVVPESGCERLLLEAFELGLAFRKVKDAPLAPSGAVAGRSVSRVSRQACGRSRPKLLASRDDDT